MKIINEEKLQEERNTWFSTLKNSIKKQDSVDKLKEIEYIATHLYEKDEISAQMLSKIDVMIMEKIAIIRSR